MRMSDVHVIKLSVCTGLEMLHISHSFSSIITKEQLSLLVNTQFRVPDLRIAVTMLLNFH